MEKKNFLDDRGAGILMPISSLASPYGIGTLGEEAYHFVDRLVKAGQKYWQVLPAALGTARISHFRHLQGILILSIWIH